MAAPPAGEPAYLPPTPPKAQRPRVWLSPAEYAFKKKYHRAEFSKRLEEKARRERYRAFGWAYSPPPK